MSRIKPWGGRFQEGTDPAVERFTASIDFDRTLVRHDIRGSIAHARMLGRAGVVPQAQTSGRAIYLLQRKPGAFGRSLGATTGWAHKLSLQRKGVQMIAGVEYQRIDDRGLHLSIDGEQRLLEVDNIIVCAGQESLRDLFDELQQRGAPAHLIGGAELAAEIDARRAIDQGCRLAAAL